MLRVCEQEKSYKSAKMVVKRIVSRKWRFYGQLYSLCLSVDENSWIGS